MSNWIIVYWMLAMTRRFATSSSRFVIPFVMFKPWLYQAWILFCSINAKLHYTDIGYGHVVTPPTDELTTILQFFVQQIHHQRTKIWPHPNILTCRDVGLWHCDVANFLTCQPNETRGHVSKLFVRQSRVDVRKYFFGNRVVKIWINLPATVEDFASIRTFKSCVNLSQYVNF